MKELYPYRFKTLEEFKKQYGDEWRYCVEYHFTTAMDKLLGQIYPHPITYNGLKIYDYGLSRFNGYHISWEMLTENKIVPNYKPKKIIRTL